MSNLLDAPPLLRTAWFWSVACFSCELELRAALDRLRGVPAPDAEETERFAAAHRGYQRAEER